MNDISQIMTWLTHRNQNVEVDTHYFFYKDQIPKIDIINGPEHLLTSKNLAQPLLKN